jgi:hypothetical protein
MEVHEGDHVRVNLAPFIGSAMRCNLSVPCKILTIDGIHVQACSEYPCREVALWVDARWIDELVFSTAVLAGV